MRVSFTNDWSYLFYKHAIGGRFANFTFLHIAYLRTGMKDLDIDGFCIIVLGLGVKFKWGK